jgi:hypothetical protein
MTHIKGHAGGHSLVETRTKSNPSGIAENAPPGDAAAWPPSWVVGLHKENFPCKIGFRGCRVFQSKLSVRGQSSEYETSQSSKHEKWEGNRG